MQFFSLALYHSLVISVVSFMIQTVPVVKIGLPFQQLNYVTTLFFILTAFIRSGLFCIAPYPVMTHDPWNDGCGIVVGLRKKTMTAKPCTPT